jgi:hypothetical protein
MSMMLPFFVLLDWKGWFRSDPLEEIVGLDTSYHGGLMLSLDDQINPEYVSAYKKRREENVRRRSERNPHISNTVLSEYDHDDDNLNFMDESKGLEDVSESIRGMEESLKRGRGTEESVKRGRGMEDSEKRERGMKESHKREHGTSIEM